MGGSEIRTEVFGEIGLQNGATKATEAVPYV